MSTVCCFFKQKTAYEWRIGDWSSYVCSSDLMTRALENTNGEGMVFANVAEVKRAFDNKAAGLHAKVKVRITETVTDEDGNKQKKASIVDTTVGRALLAEILPEGLPFELANV